MEREGKHTPIIALTAYSLTGDRSIDEIDIKDTAFKIELAARRGNLEDVMSYIDQISYEYKLYQNTGDEKGK